MKTTALLMIALGLVTSAFGELTGEARLLKEKRDAKIAEINRIYLAELGKIKVKEMQAGNTEAAEAIEAEIYGDAPKPPAYTLDSIIGKWKRTGSGTKFDGDLIEFTDTRTGSYNGKESFKIRYNESTQTITIDNGTWSNKITFTAKPDVLQAVTDSGMTYQLIRMR